jgi:tetratricopeptide (TPR) repeat protein
MGYLTIDRYDEATTYLERALVHAERAGDSLNVARAAGTLGLIAVYGPPPVAAGIARCRALRGRVVGRRATAAGLQRFEALLVAMRGDIDQARALHDEADRVVEDLGSRTTVANAVFTRANIELLAGAPERAEKLARASLQAFEAMGNRSQGSTAAAFVGLALIEQGRDDEALKYADIAAVWAVPDDIASQVTQLGIRARVLAGRGGLPPAETAARDAVAQSKGSDDPWLRGGALEDLAFVLERAGHPAEAADALRSALVIYERKGNVVSAARVRAVIESGAGVADE